MAAARPKLLLPLGGKALITRTLSVLIDCGLIEHVVVAAPEALQHEFREACAGWPNVEVAVGGATRRESVWNALQTLAHWVQRPGDALVLVHDAARCFVDMPLVRRCLEAASRLGAVTAAVPSVDSLKRVDVEGRVEESVSRAGLWCVQTPQVFWYALLRAAHERALQDPAGEATDDACLVEALHPVHVVEGSSLNFKVTTPDDYRMAQLLVGDDRSG